ncbi:hypothetical protein HID58_057876, partial [Brassica napus]
LAHLLVSHIYWENHTPLSWKLLEKAITVSIVPPLLVLALLSHKVVPNRKHHPAAYRLYLELVKRHALSLLPQIRGSGYHRTMNSIDDILHLSEIFGLPNHEPGSILLAFVFSIVWQLVDASLDDEGLLELTSNKSSNWPHDMEIDGLLKRNDNHGLLEKANTEMAITLIQFLLQNEVTSRILHLAISLPSPELAHLLVSHIYWENHTPLSWKLLEKAITVSIVPPLLVLALLSHKVVPNRKHHPAAYRLYLELLKRHAFSLMPLIRGSGYHRTMNSIDDILHLSEIFGLPNHEPGSILLAFVFSIVWQLVDASLDDEGLLELTSNKSSNWPHDMEIEH